MYIVLSKAITTVYTIIVKHIPVVHTAALKKSLKRKNKSLIMILGGEDVKTDHKCIDNIRNMILSIMIITEIEPTNGIGNGFGFRIFMTVSVLFYEKVC